MGRSVDGLWGRGVRRQARLGLFRATDRNCSSGPTTTGLWWHPTPPRRIRLSRVSRECGRQRLADFGTIGISNYDVAPDGKHIAALLPVESPEAQQTQSHVIFLRISSTSCNAKCPRASNCIRLVVAKTAFNGLIGNVLAGIGNGLWAIRP